MTAWRPWNKKDIDALEKVQHCSTRRMSDIHGSYPDRLQQLEITTLEARRSRGDAIELFKYLRGFLGVDKDATKHLYKRVFPSVRPLVRPFVGPSVGPSVGP